MRKSSLQVFKFGGPSVGNPEALRLALRTVSSAAPRVVVVVSAMSGVTDLLLDAARAGAAGNKARWTRAAGTFRDRHAEAIAALITRRSARRELAAALEASPAALAAICQSVSVLRELTPRTLDAVAARGERFIARLFAAFLNENEVPASYVDATEVIVTERHTDGLWPDFEASEKAARRRLGPLLRRKRVAVVPGYIAAGPDGQVVTLGRGGSDYSATLLARSIDAASVSLFKDVDGLMTADPKHVPEARVLPELHYREAAELAFYGATVLHPRTMIPLVEKRIPLFLRNAFNPGFSGTRIAHNVPAGTYPVKALTAIHSQALVSIEGSGMIGVPGIAARAFTALSHAGHSVSMISQASSEASICFVVPQSEVDAASAVLSRAFAQELDDRIIDAVRVEREVALVAVVGRGMAGLPGIAARAAAPLAREKINIRAIAQGSSELNITLAIRHGDHPAALRALHREFQLDRLRPRPNTDGREASIALFGLGQIGRTLARQILSQERYFLHLGLDLRCFAVGDRTGLRADEKGFSSAVLEQLCKRKESGHPLVPRGKALSLAHTLDKLREELFTLPVARPVFVDVTAVDDAPIVLEALKHGFHVALANKKPLAASQSVFDELFATAREKGVQLRYEATVGAGLPILDTLKKLQEAGDNVHSVLGCLSGTLGYLMSQLEEGIPFSEAVRSAHRAGYTEPDPKEDLSGMDVARKALILARTIGLKAELSDMPVEPLFPKELAGLSPETFLKRLPELDADMAARVRLAKRKKQVLRYIARVDEKGVRVGLESVPENSPMGRLKGLDNQIVLYTDRYRQNPMVVTGPGAGAEVTAAGVLNDVLAIASGQDRRP